MKPKWIRYFILFLPMFCFFSASALADTNKKIVEDFSEYRSSQFPTWWKTWPFQRNDAKKVYRVMKEKENRFLRSEENESLSKQIYKGFDWQPLIYPYLNWKWRARVLPEGANETKPETNDSACAVYVAFGRTSKRSMKFTWSSTLPEGTIHVKEPGKTVFKILDGGAKHLNQWRGHSIHLKEIYKELFKSDMNQEPSGIAILTDGNAVNKKAACDYDDFSISKKPIY